MHWRDKIRESVTEAKLIVKPLLMPAIAVGGLWLGAYQLSIAPWHHLTIVWVVGLGLAIHGSYQTYRSIADRVRMARWLDEEEDAVAAERVEEAAAWAKRLPSSYREDFYSRRTTLRRAGLASYDA